MPTVTPRLGLAQPIGSDSTSEIRIADTANMGTLDNAALYLRGTLAARPLAGSVTAGTFYDATDTGTSAESDGTVWRVVTQTGGLTSGQLSSTAGIAGSQLSSTAGIAGSQLSAAAGITDGQLASPNTGVRRLLLQITGWVNSGTAGGDYLLGYSLPIASGVAATTPVPVFVGDAGLSGHPQDFQIPGKAAYCTVRATLLTGNVNPGVSYTVGLYPLTGVSGASGQVIYNFPGSQYASAAAFVTPAAGNAYSAESSAVALPSGGWYMLGVFFNGVPNGVVHITAQLFGFNA